MSTGLTAWIGTERATPAWLDPGRAGALAATLGCPAPEPAALLPPLWHWLYFWDTPTPADLAPDGHARRGGFLPPVDLPHRMWAGGRIWFERPLRLGQTATRNALVQNVVEKEGRSGPLVFVTVRAEINDAAGGRVVEEQDIVYRGPRTAPEGEPAPSLAAWARRVTPDSVMLFRYSALTFNGHRIHYDRGYATAAEGYGGLVVHGPLLATLCLDLLRTEAAWPWPRRFTFRALRPVLDTAPFEVCGAPGDAADTANLWIRDAGGQVAMRATANLGPV